jgi:hypothetical protein
MKALVVFLAITVAVIFAQSAEDREFQKQLGDEFKNALKDNLKAKLKERLAQLINKLEEVDQSQEGKKKKKNFFGRIGQSLKGLGKELGPELGNIAKQKLTEKLTQAVGGEEVEFSQRKQSWFQREFGTIGKELGDAAKDALKKKLLETLSKKVDGI